MPLPGGGGPTLQTICRSQFLAKFLRSTFTGLFLTTDDILTHLNPAIRHAGKLTTTALLSIPHDCTQALDMGREASTAIVFFDISKAFDTVPHLPLLRMLALILSGNGFTAIYPLENNAWSKVISSATVSAVLRGLYSALCCFWFIY